MSEQNISAKVSEEDLYAAALAEVQSGTTRSGLWAKAFADSEGDENKSKALYIKLRVQQEQKAADALAAESVRRKAAEFQSILDRLLFNGYGVKRTAAGWAVREPLGGRVKFDSDKSLLEYAQRHGVQLPPPGEHPKAGGLFENVRTHKDSPELRDIFSSKPAERTDEKSGPPGEGASATRRPYEWGSVLTWTLSLLLWGISTPSSTSMRGLGVKMEAINRFAFGVLWAVIGGIIVAVIKHFKRSPIPTSVDAKAKAASIDKALFVASIVLAIFFAWKAIYFGTYGAFFDSAIVGVLGFGVKSGFAPARWLMAAYAFINPFIVIALGGVGNTMIWAFVFFAAAHSIIARQDALNNGEPHGLPMP